MTDQAGSSSQLEIHLEEDDYDLMYGSESGWVEAKTYCDHLASLSSDLGHIPIPNTPCNRRAFLGNSFSPWLCEISDLSVWCFSCDSYLDAQLIQQLRPVHETAYILKFGEAPPLPSVEFSGTEDKPARYAIKHDERRTWLVKEKS
ncbi:uncharacterized protein LOC120215029 [Hibiscus syriacus]|uniref:uncharacterized protein LOC120215029 n=1 Tax=Hibiscus syriacus TaxID=106335 RepID=UPI001920EE95|nr:uncharacterized protein LOC120215029 [Hibiscus syriacus]